MTTKRQRRSHSAESAASDMPAGGSLCYSWSRQFQPEGRADINVFSTSTGTVSHVEQLLKPADGDYPDAKTAPGYFCPRCVNTESRKGKGSAAPGMFWRDGDSIADQSIYGFDFDFKQKDGTMHPDALAYAEIIRDALEESPCWWALYTTASHTEEWPRLRVVLATDRPADGPDQMLLVRASLLDRFFKGIPVDSATFTPAQVMYRAPADSAVTFSESKNPMRLAAVLRHARENEVEAPKAARRASKELTIADDLAAVFQPFMDALLSKKGAHVDAGSVTLPATEQHGRQYSSGNHETSLRFSPPGQGFTHFNVTFVHDTDKEATRKMSHTDKLRYACEAAGVDFDLLAELQANYHQLRNSAGGPDQDRDGTTPVQQLAEGVGAAPRNSGLLPVALEPLPVIPLPDEEAIQSFADVLYVEPEVEECDRDTLDDLRDAAMEKALESAKTILTHKWFQDCFVFIANGSNIFDVTEPPNIVKPYRIQDFRNTMAPFQFITRDEKGKPKTHQYAESWMVSQNRQAVRDTVFEPGKPRITDVAGIPMINTYYIAPFKMTDEHDLLDEFMKIVDRTHPIPKEKDIFLDWLAFSFRYPQQKILWAYTNISEARGSGRGLLANAVGNLLGHNNVVPTKLKIVAADTYHDYAHQALVSIIEEGDSDETGKRIKVDGHWNDIITSQRSLLNLKYGGQIKSNLYNNFMIFLNHYSLIIDKSDRRIQAITGAPKDTPPIDAAWVSEYSSIFNVSKEFRDQLASFLWTRDLSDFDYGHCDRSLPAREKLLAASETPADEIAEEVINSLPGCVIDASGLKKMIGIKCANQKITDEKTVYMVLKMKAREAGKAVTAEGKTYRCYVFGEPAQSYAAELKLNLAKLGGLSAHT